MPEPMGFFTDTTVCIGCKACQVACHQWNDLPAGHGPQRTSLPVLSGDSYDNTGSFSDVNWRHVKFIEEFSADPNRTSAAWLMMSDVCKHCVNAPCLEVCPTGAILRTEFDTVFINEPTCNGCRDCVGACPFGVIHMSERKHVAQKCTLCYDRLQKNLTPACAQACPTQSIRFGKISELKPLAEARVNQLKREGVTQAQLYGADDKVLGGLNAFYLLVDKPEKYGLPSDPKLPSRNVPRSSFWSIFAALLTGLGVLFSFRNRGNAARVVARSPDRATSPTAGLPGFSETSGQPGGTVGRPCHNTSEAITANPAEGQP
ncbi:MAG TPA: 4Fe-4S dicluster domain-containing protein [Gemmataceae bacterium]|nr:4Fe-4S dicluster domain-containing protein [Gemmataceae bacterium]